ncbi:lactadherin isoform X2 [Nematostella vectensis]|uniref:lactadherin isoform X2 n=1 Tax=Nematostella vectensis TaxID=45351 RepID=UPI0020771CC6|nr:lactadherin isoform X2 [Nematostella vectensis]
MTNVQQAADQNTRLTHEPVNFRNICTLQIERIYKWRECKLNTNKNSNYKHTPHASKRLQSNLEGCANKPHPLGMEDGSIQDTSITASSHWIEPGHNPHHARLNNQPVSGQHIGAWAAKYNQKGEYLEVDLGQVTWITHVATQGRPKGTGSIHWVTEYSVEYSLKGDQWQSYQDGNGVIKVFHGNSDMTTVVKNEFSPVIQARYVRIVAHAWYGYIAMRAEFYGCAA